MPSLKLPHGLTANLVAVWLAVFGLLAAACSDGADSAQPVIEPVTPTATAALIPTSTVPRPTVSAIAIPTSTIVVQPTAQVAPTAVAIPTATAPPPPTPVPPTVEVNHARYGGTLHLVSRRNILHQDVHQDLSAALSAWGPGMAYSRLMRFKSGADVALPSLAVECEVCLSWRMTDLTTYEFKLRDDVFWQMLQPVNGRRVVASDIAFSYERQRSSGMPNGALLHLVTDIEASADDVLRLRIQAADADFMSALANGNSKIVAREAVELNGDLRNGPTAGSGAWVLAETQSDAAHIFERNESYFEEGAPYLNGLRVHIIPDGDTAYAAFRVHNVDVHQLQPQQWAEVQRQQPNAAALMYEEIGTGLEVAFKTTASPFDDIRVRRATMLSMRPHQAIQDIWMGAAYLTQGVPLANVGWRLNDDEMSAYFDDRSRAVELLADAGESLPVEISIKVGNFGEPFRMHADRMADEMRSIGFEPQIEVVNRREFGEDVWFGGDYQMLAGPLPPMMSPNGYMLGVLSSDGVWNTTEHRSETLDALIAAQAQEYDPNVRAQLVREVQHMALDQAYRFMPAAAVSLWAWWPEVQGFHPNFAGNEYSHWSKVWLR